MMLTNVLLASDDSKLCPEQESRFSGQCLSRPSRVAATLLILFLAWLAGTNSAFAQTDETAFAAAAEATKVDINAADAESLAAGLVGIGLTKAREIVRYRELHGDFIAIEELAEVKGIGLATVEKNRHILLVAGPAMDRC